MTYLPLDLEPKRMQSPPTAADPAEELRRARAEFEHMLDMWDAIYPATGPRSRYEFPPERAARAIIRLAAAERRVGET